MAEEKTLPSAANTPPSAADPSPLGVTAPSQPATAAATATFRSLSSFQPAAIRRQLAALPVVKSGLSLMTGTIVTSALGLIFWILAANLYNTAQFGVSSTAVYTMMMLADVACLGLRTGLVRYVPTAGRATARTIMWGYALVFAASVVTALVFLIGLGWWAPDLHDLRNSSPRFLFFVAATAFWALFMLEDAVLVGLRKAPWVPVENSIFGLAKIALLFPFVAWSPKFGIFWAWTIPVFPIVIGVNVFIARVAIARSGRRNVRSLGDRVRRMTRVGVGSRQLLRDIITFSLADWFAAVARLVALGVIPLMVLAQLDQTQAGYFQASWLIAFTIFALSSNAAYALLAETSYEQASLNKNSIQAGLLSLALTLPVIVVGVVGAPILLRIYGAEYADNSSTVLRILLIAAVPNVIHQIYVGRLRSQGRMGRVVLFETLLSFIVVAAAWLFLPRYGINGVGLAWLLGLTLLAVYITISESMWWWASRLDTKLIRRLGAGLRRYRRGRPARGMDRRLGGVLTAVEAETATPDVTWLQFGDHGQTAIVSMADDRELMVDFARSKVGADELDRGRHVLEALAADERLVELHSLLPSLLGHGQLRDREFVASSRPTGPSALDLVRRGVPIEEICQATFASLRPLHEVTGRVVDDAPIGRWIDESLSHLGRLGRVSDANIARLGELLTSGFSGVAVEVGRVHGGLTLANIIMASEPTRVTGLLHWEWSTELPLIVDPATLALNDLSIRGHRELGAVVRSLLSDPAEFEQHPAMADQPETAVGTRAVILLTWLHMVGRPLAPRRAVLPELWLARNAQPVLAGLQAGVGTTP